MLSGFGICGIGVGGAKGGAGGGSGFNISFIKIIIFDFFINLSSSRTTFYFIRKWVVLARFEKFVNMYNYLAT
jgi:hypothetical protein